MSAARRTSQRSKRNRARMRDIQRGSPRRNALPRVLIVCEGGKTEPNYFNGFREEKNLPTLNIRVVGSDKAGGTDPKTLVEHAKNEKENAERQRDAFAAVWCVFDRDQHAKIHEAFDQAKKNGINIAFSNPSFELWYLLHFQHQGATIDRREVVQLLTKHLPQYNKAHCSMWTTLVDNLDIAIERAQMLRKQHHITDETCTGESPNPSTWVDTLVTYLISTFP